MNFHPEVLRRAFAYGASYRATGLLAANVSEQAFAPASNTGGAVVWRAGGWSRNAVGLHHYSLQAHTAAPNSPTGGEVLAVQEVMNDETGFVGALLVLREPVYLRAGVGLYFNTTSAETHGYRFALYTLFS